jgi:hypothetical protein
MSEHPGLDDRLRAALGASGNIGADGRSNPEAAKSRVLSGIHRRRSRRLQVAGVACVVALGLAVSLPQVLGGSAPQPQATGTHSKSSTSAASPTRSPTAGAAASPASTAGLSATCRVAGRSVTRCGVLATTASAALKLTTAARSNEAAFGGLEPDHALGSPLVVEKGKTFLVELPRVKSGWRWATPTIAGSSVSGANHPVVVRQDGTRHGVARFVVTAQVVGTVVLDAQERVFEGKAGAPSIVAQSWPAWALEVEVEGT